MFFTIGQFCAGLIVIFGALQFVTPRLKRRGWVIMAGLLVAAIALKLMPGMTQSIQSNPMQAILTCLIMTGVLTIIYVLPLARERAKMCYALMMLIPMSAIAMLFALNGWNAYHQKSQTLSKQEIRIQEQSLKQALEDNPDNVQAVIDLAGHYIEGEKFVEAIALLEAAQLKSPEDKDLQLQYTTAYFAYGLYEAEHKRYETALHHLRFALGAAPEDAPYLDDLKRFIAQITALHAGEDFRVEIENHLKTSE